MADEHLHQSEAELSEFEQYMQQREAARDVFGGVLIESTTDSLDDIAAAAFQPEIVQGPKVEIGTQGVRTKAGGTERDDETGIEDYRQAVAGKELRADQQAFKRRADEFAQSHPGFDQALNQGGEIPLGVQRTILRLPNGPAVAHFLAVSPEMRLALCDLAGKGRVLEAVAMVQRLSKDLAFGGMNLNGTYTEFRDGRNRSDQLRRRPR